MTRRGKHRFAIVIVVLIVIPIAAYAALWLTFGRGVFAGESEHNFGVVIVDGPLTVVEYTFKLTNNTGSAITIAQIKPSCSRCMIMEDLENNTIEAGATFELKTGLALPGQSGKSRKSMAIILEDDRVHQLWLEAYGRSKNQLEVTTPYLQVDAEGKVKFVVFAEVWEDADNPPEPVIETSDGITSELLTWTQVGQANETIGRPARWKALTMLTMDGDASVERGFVTTRFKDSEISIPVVAQYSNQPDEGPGTPGE